jgi:hypothetical protein
MQGGAGAMDAKASVNQRQGAVAAIEGGAGTITATAKIQLDDVTLNSKATTAASAGAAALAGVRSDGVSDQDDLLDIEHDVAALCSVIAARDVEPPLSIGLFGDWGSGKSFFLEAMREQLKRIEKAAEKAEQDAITNNQPIKDATRYCARITQLEFNAWRYIDTDLWASLAQGIIDGLARTRRSARCPRPSARGYWRAPLIHAT